MIKDAFKLEEIHAIIDKCVTSGVVLFEYNGLKLTMGMKPPEPLALNPEQYSIAETQTRAATAQDEFNKKQRDLDQLLIDDPEGYFEAIKSGDLEDEERA